MQILKFPTPPDRIDRLKKCADTTADDFVYAMSWGDLNRAEKAAAEMRGYLRAMENIIGMRIKGDKP